MQKFNSTALLMCIAILWVANGCTAEHNRNGTLPDEINVAIELSPLCLDINGDTLSGFSFEILQAWCMAHGEQFELTPFNSIGDAMESNNNDAIKLFIFDVPATISLRENFILTAPIYTDKTVLVQSTASEPDSLISSAEELGGMSVWITNNSPIRDRLHNLGQEIGDTIYVREVDNYSEEQLILLVAMGKIQRAATSLYTAQGMAQKFSHLDISINVSFNQFRSWMLHPADSVLRDSIDSWLSQFSTTDQYRELIKKYNLN